MRSEQTTHQENTEQCVYLSTSNTLHMRPVIGLTMLRIVHSLSWAREAADG